LRIGYAWCVEDSVYVAGWARGRGVGRQLLRALAEACAARGARQMVAVIGDSTNTASIVLHRACGFREVGLLPAIGFKAGRWLDSVLMQRPLGEGAGSPPVLPPP
jgi:phosphinothricin acetyltransferase